MTGPYRVVQPELIIAGPASMSHIGASQTEDVIYRVVGRFPDRPTDEQLQEVGARLGALSSEAVHSDVADMVPKPELLLQQRRAIGIGRVGLYRNVGAPIPLMRSNAKV